MEAHGDFYSECPGSCGVSNIILRGNATWSTPAAQWRERTTRQCALVNADRLA